MAQKNTNAQDKIKKPRAKKGTNVMSPPVPAGTTLQDLAKEKWIIGPAIGQGGFGIIYSARSAKESVKDFPYVVKFEPHLSGPLFVERNFYLKVAKEADIKAWVKSHSLPYLGLPRYLGSGSSEIQNVMNRFLVTDRYSVDLWSKFLENNRQFPLSTVLRVGLQVLNVLQYIHSTGYVHMDVKASNLMLGREKVSQNRVFLIDFGLVTKATTNVEYKRDPKQAHNGTIEYLSRDAHDGVPSMRGDLEVLGFNMLHWRASTLPWEQVALTGTKGKEVEVQKLKIKFMENICEGLKSLKLDNSSADFVTEYLMYVKNMKHDKTPDYDKVCGILQKTLNKIGASDKGPLDFSSGSVVTKTVSTRRTKKTSASIDEDEKPAKGAKVAKPRNTRKKIPEPEEPKPEGTKDVKALPRRKPVKVAAGVENEGKTQSKGGKKVVKRRNVKVASDSESEEEEEDPKPKKAVVDSESEKEEVNTKPKKAVVDSESEKEEVDTKPKKAAVARATRIPRIKSQHSSVSSESDIEEETKQSTASKRVPRKVNEVVVKKDDSYEDSKHNDTIFATPTAVATSPRSKGVYSSGDEGNKPRNKRFAALVLQSPLSTPSGSREIQWLKKQQSNTVIQTPEMSEDDTPKFTRMQTTQRLKLLAQTPEITDDESPRRRSLRSPLDIFEDAVSSPRGLIRMPAAQQVNYREESSEGEEEIVIDNTPTPPKKQRLGRSAIARLTAEGDTLKNGTAEEEKLPKWKQCATIQASNVERPGEYTRQLSDAKNKKN